MINVNERHLSELKQQKIWLLWRKETRKNSKGEVCPTKVPINAHGVRTGTDPAHAGDWMTFDEAVSASGGVTCAGIGFKIPDGVFFLDIDHRDLGDPLVKTLLERFGSYAERSCSGNGYHIYGRYDLKAIPAEEGKDGKVKLAKEYYLKNPHNGIELYFGDLTNRFAVFTGDCVYDAPLKDCTGALLTTLEKEMRRDAAKPAAAKKQPAFGSETGEFRKHLSETCDADTIRFLNKLYSQKNGEKFRRLFEEGDISAYGSQSEADLALCGMIAFRTGDDPESIDRIFRLSALYRDKWEREDYRESTIRLAVGSCNGQFRKTSIVRPYFITENDQGDEKVSPPLLAQYVRENLQYIMVRSSAREELLMYVYRDGVYRLADEKMFRGIIRCFIEDYDMTLVRVSTLKEV